MTFISYAQNFEDVMLWRALKHVPNGFYIDIGAQDPIIDSVSRAFYEHGWHGLHVEPTEQYSKKLREARPDETILQVAIGNAEGSLTFYEIENTGLSTADEVIAKRHKDAGFPCRETKVPVVSLDSLFDQYAEPHVHWLKLDVEGLEKSVLETWRYSSVRPWVLVIESTKPLTQEEDYAGWESIVLGKGYQFAYFDGLNRFYVSLLHAELANAFSSPPNVFDGFQLSGLASPPFCSRVVAQAQQAESKAQQAESKAEQAESKAEQAESKAEQAESKAEQAESKAEQAESKAQQAESKAQQAESKARQAEEKYAVAWHNYQAIANSSSWKITYPLRIFGGFSKWVIQGGRAWITFTPGSRPRRTLNRFLSGCKRWIKSKPRLATLVRSLLLPFPRLRARLRRIGNSRVVPGRIEIKQAGDYSTLSPRARRIFCDIEAATKTNKIGQKGR
jgi:FkbM family methyltransferase